MNLQALLEPLPVDDGSVTRLRQEAGDDARVLLTDHFALAHTAPEDTVRALADRMEAVYRAHARFVRELGLPAARPRRKLPVLVFATYDAFRAYLQRRNEPPEETLGFYDSRGDRALFFDLATYPPIVQLRADGERAASDPRWRRELARTTEALLGKVVQHEVAHQIQYSAGVVRDGGGMPAWLVEGMAQLFELPFVERGATLELSTNRYRLYEFMQRPGDDPADLAELRRLVAGDGAWRGGADYALGWALTNYLYKRQRQSLGEYLRWLAGTRNAAATATPGRADFERFFGPVDEDFAARFGAYMRALAERFEVRKEAPAVPGERTAPEHPTRSAPPGG